MERLLKATCAPQVSSKDAPPGAFLADERRDDQRPSDLVLLRLPPARGAAGARSNTSSEGTNERRQDARGFPLAFLRMSVAVAWLHVSPAVRK